jgi:hypothetical protein
MKIVLYFDTKQVLPVGKTLLQQENAEDTMPVQQAVLHQVSSLNA